MYKQSGITYLLGFLLISSLLGCIPVTSGEQTKGNDTPVASSTSLPVTTTALINTPSLPTPTHQVITPDVTDLPLPCSMLTSTNSPDQVNYRGIYPGRTTSDALKGILGSPVEVNAYEPGVQEWMFELDGERGTFPIGIKDGMVVSIYIPDKMPLAPVFRQYGCPDVVFAVDMSEHKSGQYSATFLVYLQLGVEFTVEQFPMDLSDEIIATHYFSPGALEDFLHENPSLQSEIVAKQVALEDALK